MGWKLKRTAQCAKCHMAEWLAAFRDPQDHLDKIFVAWAVVYWLITAAGVLARNHG